MNEGLFVPVSELKEIAEKIVKQVTTTGKDYFNDEAVRAAILAESTKINGLRDTINNWKGVNDNCNGNTSIPNSKKILASLKELGPYIIFYMFTHELFEILNDMITQMNRNINDSSIREIETNITTLITEGFALYETFMTSNQRYTDAIDARDKNIAKNTMNSDSTNLAKKLGEIKTALNNFEKSNKTQYEAYWNTITPVGSLQISSVAINASEPRRNFAEKIKLALNPPTDDDTKTFLKSMLDSVTKELNSRAAKATNLEKRYTNYKNLKGFTDALLAKYHNSDEDRLNDSLNEFDAEPILQRTFKNLQQKNPKIKFMTTFPFTNKAMSENLPRGLSLNDLDIVVHYANQFPPNIDDGVANVMIVIWCKCFIIKCAEWDSGNTLNTYYFSTPKRGGTKRKKSKDKTQNYTRKNIL